MCLLLDLYLQSVLVAAESGVAIGPPGQREQIFELVVIVGGTGKDVFHVVGADFFLIVLLLAPEDEGRTPITFGSLGKSNSRVGADLRIATHCFPACLVGISWPRSQLRSFPRSNRTSLFSSSQLINAIRLFTCKVCSKQQPTNNNKGKAPSQMTENIDRTLLTSAVSLNRVNTAVFVY